MSISINKYVDITSGVGGASAVANRQLIGRYITTSSSLNPGQLYQFNGIDDVEAIFPATAPEYLAAAKYFAFVSKLNTGANMLSMYGWAKTATAPQLVGAGNISGSAVLTALKACTALSLSVTDNFGNVTAVGPVTLNLTGAADFNALAQAVQTALRAAKGPTIAAPVATSATASGTGGTLAAASYFYKITATNANGETIGSNEVTATTTGTTSSIALLWAGVTGATGYKVYRGAASGAYTAVPSFVIASGATLTFTDVGGAGTSATLPTTNSTGAVIPQLTNCNVQYTAVPGRFTIQGSVLGTGDITGVTSGVSSSVDFAVQGGLLASAGAQSIDGVNAQAPVDAVTASANISDNFGAFGFIDSSTSPPMQLASADSVAVATWNDAQNNKFMYCVPTTVLNAPTDYANLKGYSGAAMSISLNDGQDYAEFCPMEVLAATDYTRANSSQNYMFYEFENRTPTVSDTPTSDAMDAVRANYVGQVMSAGQQIAFYQRGVLMGGSSAATDMNTYANEMWLKSNITANILNAFLGLPRIPASDVGRGLILANVQASIDAATTNGTISVGKLLTSQQKQYITGVTNDPNAWQQIQNIGYWIDVEIQSYQTVDGRTEYKAVYVLVYAKDDQVRMVEGSDNLI